jgi:hypothetical protein
MDSKEEHRVNGDATEMVSLRQDTRPLFVAILGSI